MTDMIGGGLGGMTGALQGTISGVVNKGQSLLDRFFPPERRQAMAEKISKFATEKPMLASFLLSQIAISGIPLGLFVVMTIGVAVFALLAGLLVGLLGALLFIVFCVGFALIILLPVLFMTTFAAAFIWLWGVGAYYITKWFNKKEIPGVHTKLGDSAGLSALTGGGSGQGQGGERKREGANGTPHKGHDSEKAPRSNGSAGKKLGQSRDEDKSHHNTSSGKGSATDKLSDVGKTTGADIPDVNDVKKNVNVGDLGNVKDKLPGGVL